MVKLWLTEIEKDLILDGLRLLQKKSIDDAQWAIFTQEIVRLRERIFHEGEEDE